MFLTAAARRLGSPTFKLYEHLPLPGQRRLNDILLTRSTVLGGENYELAVPTRDRRPPPARDRGCTSLICLVTFSDMAMRFPWKRLNLVVLGSFGC